MNSISQIAVNWGGGGGRGGGGWGRGWGGVIVGRPKNLKYGVK